MNSLEQQLLSTNVVLIAVGAWFVLWVLSKIWTGMDNNKWVKHLKPLYPAILCQGFVWIPGALADEPVPTIGTHILIGLWCGFLASIGYQLVKRLLGQKGIELPDNPEDLIPGSESDNDKQPANDPEDEKSTATPIDTPIPQGEEGDGDGDGETKSGDAA